MAIELRPIQVELASLEVVTLNNFSFEILMAPNKPPCLARVINIASGRVEGSFTVEVVDNSMEVVDNSVTYLLLILKLYDIILSKIYLISSECLIICFCQYFQIHKVSFYPTRLCKSSIC